MFDTLNESVLTVFGEPFTYKGSGGAAILEGVFDERVDQERIGGIGLADRVFTLSLKQSDAESSAIAIRETVQVRGMNYQIIDIHTDVGGMTTLILRPY